MKRQQVINCMFSSWYPNFKRVTFKSRVLPIPKDFLDYLNEDGVVLPADELKGNETQGSQDRCSYLSEDWSNESDEDSLPVPQFPKFCQEINHAITELGGCVFPKLNWTSPRDASWITPDGTLRCCSFTDICLLLKSSDFVTHDLTRAFEQCADCKNNLADEHFVIALRQWVDIIPGMEFRCFVRDYSLVAISQRDTSTFYEYLEPCKRDLHEDITAFFRQHILHKFPDADFVFDVYRYAKGKVKLIDFNPFNPSTDSLLFSWDELRTQSGSFDEGVSESAEGLVETTEGILRIIERVEGIQPSPFLQYRMPKDILDVSSGEDINKLVDFLNTHDLVANEN